MALAMQQEASIGGFNVFFGLNICVFVEQLGAQKKLSVSMVNLIEEWHWFKISRKLTADVLSGMIVSVSSTYLLWYVGILPSRFKVSSMLHMKKLANRGPRGEPIATPSVCSCKWLLNKKSWSFVAALRRSTRPGYFFSLYVLIVRLHFQNFFTLWTGVVYS